MKDAIKELMGPLEILFLEKMLEKDGGVDYTDFIGTGITLENIDQVALNVDNAFFEANPDYSGINVSYYPPMQ